MKAEDIRSAFEKALKDCPVDGIEMKRRLEKAAKELLDDEPIENHLEIKVTSEPTERAPIFDVTVKPKTEWGRRIIEHLRREE